MIRAISLLSLLIILNYAPVIAQHHSDSTRTLRSEYAGQESRLIKSLSPSDLRQLRNGEGWGLAKAAELNGYPGPKHVLEMSSEIELTGDQHNQVTALFNAMKREATRLGMIYIEKEKNLNEAYANGTITPGSLKTLLKEINNVLADLRYTHQITHLETRNILTADQIAEYNRLRGYDSITDPCSNIPEGHDPVMWKMHNNCN
ncbi:hypothetical protein AB2B38_012255 [Balneola sp. MJW-20]|uniref:hypothetical protein n=1 Tax=Gracilimonas aurantiaca TaxID=3234185 RepID=UPI0034651E63